MKNIEIYTRPGCGYCSHTKTLLASEGLTYIEHDISLSSDKLSEMQARTSNRTFPQIFIDNESIGGFEELLALKKHNNLPRNAA